MKPSRRSVLTALAVFLVALAIPYVAFDREKSTLTQTARRDLGGSYVALTDGFTHYAWEGPADGPVVVLIHGFSTPMYNWDRTVPALAAAGFRVLRYDLFGRGFSDRPAVDYDRDLFDRQLVELTAALKIEGPVPLVGLSMGGAVAAIFAARHPERVNRLALIAPAGFPVEIPLTGKLVRLPVLGTYLMKVAGDRTLEKSVRRALYRPEREPDYIHRFGEQLAFKGYKRAIVSTLRHFDLNDQRAAFEAAGAHPRPVLLIWGRQDAIVPFAHSARVLAAMPRARLVALDEAGHCCQYEASERVNPALVSFLTGKAN